MSETTDDLSSLAWVYEGVRRSLDTAHKALRRFVKDREAAATTNADRVDPTPLRAARLQIHQCAGALELVGMNPLAVMLRASEAAVVRYIAKPHELNLKAVEVIERASFALLDFIGRVLGGKAVSPLSLFPQYQAVQQAAGADRVHPADLWSVALRWLELPADATVQAHPPNAAMRAAIEQELLVLVRADDPRGAAKRLSDAFASIAKAARHPQIVICWKLAAAVFEAQAHGLLRFDVYTKRLGSRLLAQFRNLAKGEIDVSERLALDLLFFCAQSRAATPATPRLAAVRQVYGLDAGEPADYTTSPLGRYDPAWVAQARKRVAAAKETWSAVAGGEMHRLSGLSEQFSLVGDSLKRLFPLGETLAKGLHDAATMTVETGATPPATLAMEVATSLLYVDAVLEDAEFDHPQQAQRVQRLTQRLFQVRQGKAPEPLESWMEELYRRVSDKQTMGSVVQELRASLSEAEKLIDKFFRDTSDPRPLDQVPKHLSAMRGVLSVLGMDHASTALVKMRDEVNRLATAKVELPQAAQAGVFQRLAENLGAMGFLIDMLSVQPQMAKSLFNYDAVTGSLRPIMGRGDHRSALAAHAAMAGSALEQKLVDQARQLASDATRQEVSPAELVRGLERLARGASAAERTGLAQATRDAQQALVSAASGAGVSAARAQVSKALTDFVLPHGEAAIPEREIAPPKRATPSTPAPAKAPVAAVPDDDLLEVFLEEAREVIGDARNALTELNEFPGELSILTTIRRAFHTLKGSSRMVGLKDFGEAAWTCEKLYNTSLAEQRAADRDLLQFTHWALQYLGSWVDEIAARSGHEHSSAAVVAWAQAHTDAGDGRESRAESRSVSKAAKHAPASAPGRLAPAAPPVPAPAPAAAFVPSRPAAQPLDLSFGLGSQPVVEPSPALASTPAIRAESAPAYAETVLVPFDLSPTEALGVPQKSDAAVEDLGFDLIDLDLDEELPEAPPLEPSAPTRVMGSAEPRVPDLGLETPAQPARQEAAPRELNALASVPAPRPEAMAEKARVSDETDAELVKVVGPLRISIALFNIYLNEADELSRRLSTELAEWGMELERPIGEIPIALAHSLAGSSATVGFADLSNLARTLEHALTRSQAIGRGTHQEARLFVDAAEEIRRLLHQFAAGFLKDPSVSLLSRLDEHELSSARWLQAATAAADTPPQTRPDTLGDLATSADSQTRSLGDSLATPLAGDSQSVALAAVATSAPSLAPEAVVAPDLPQAAASPVPPMPRAAPPASTATPSGPLHVEVAAAPHPASPAPIATREEVTGQAAQAPEGRTASEQEELRSWFQPSGIMEWKPLTFAPSGVPSAVPGPEATLPLPTPAAHDRRRVPRHGTPGASGAQDGVDEIDAIDAVDAELFPIFEEESLELLPLLAGSLREWIENPADLSHAESCKRTLHTLKGGARLAGAMRLGELAHRLETRIEHILAQPTVSTKDIENLQSNSDALAQVFDALRHRDAQAYAQAGAAIAGLPRLAAARGTEPGSLSKPLGSPPPEPGPITRAHMLEPLEQLVEIAPVPVEAAVNVSKPARPEVQTEAHAGPGSSAGFPAIDWSRFDTGTQRSIAALDRSANLAQSAVRVRTPMLDRLVNQAGEVSIARTRIESQVNLIKGSVGDLTENLERLRMQLRDIEVQAETQMSSRLEAAKTASKNFDPLEFDRFTRFQEVTRMMAESVNDVATVQRTLQRSLESTEDELVAQARVTRELQGDLLRTRMVEFEGLSDRLYRVVRQAAKELGKQVRLDIVGGSIEIDRGVLDRITGAFEHVLRNCVTHGIEMPQVRIAAGKDPTGLILVTVTHEGNEVAVEFRDDGAGLDLTRIRERGIALGLLDATQAYSDAELANLIFASGFSTVSNVTELAGRGVGMDVVRSEVNAIGGRIATATRANQGTSFKLILPLTTAVTQVLMLRCGATAVAVPSTLIEIVRRATSVEIDQAHTSGVYVMGERQMPFFWLGALLELSPRSEETIGRTRTVVVIRSAQKRVAVQVDEVLGNQEVVVKNLGPQLSRVPGLAGITLLASGVVALIYNPVALATLYGPAARQATLTALQAPQSPAGGAAADEAPLAPMVLVVDDSLTVRRVTQRLLAREGYRVVLAKDGLDALEKLAEESPQVVLCDIEMPRMDGFELVRNIRNTASLRDLPVIMITSRIAQKHRDLAADLGVDHYMGKPYSEEDLLSLIAHYTATLSDA